VGVIDLDGRFGARHFGTSERWAHVRRRRGDVPSIWMWSEGLTSIVIGRADLTVVAEVAEAWLSVERPSGDAMVARFPFLTMDPFGGPVDEGAELELRWRRLLAPVNPRGDKWAPFVDAAAAEPLLRRMYPHLAFFERQLLFSRTRGGGSELMILVVSETGEYFAVRMTPRYSLPDVVLGFGSPDQLVRLIYSGLPDD